MADPDRTPTSHADRTQDMGEDALRARLRELEDELVEARTRNGQTGGGSAQGISPDRGNVRVELMVSRGSFRATRPGSSGDIIFDEGHGMVQSVSEEMAEYLLESGPKEVRLFTAYDPETDAPEQKPRFRRLKSGEKGQHEQRGQSGGRGGRDKRERDERGAA